MEIWREREKDLTEKEREVRLGLSSVEIGWSVVNNSVSTSSVRVYSTPLFDLRILFPLTRPTSRHS